MREVAKEVMASLCKVAEQTKVVEAEAEPAASTTVEADVEGEAAAPIDVDSSEAPAPCADVEPCAAVETIPAEEVTPSNMEDLNDAILEMVSEVAKRVNLGVDDKISSDAAHHVFVWEVKNISSLPADIQKIATEQQKVWITLVPQLFSLTLTSQARVKHSKLLCAVCEVCKVLEAGQEEEARGVDGLRLQDRTLLTEFAQRICTE